MGGDSLCGLAQCRPLQGQGSEEGSREVKWRVYSTCLEERVAKIGIKKIWSCLEVIFLAFLLSHKTELIRFVSWPSPFSIMSYSKRFFLQCTLTQQNARTCKQKSSPLFRSYNVKQENVIISSMLFKKEEKMRHFSFF